jgi:hypothetical protein
VPVSSRWIELVLFAVTLKLCLIMWLIARRAQSRAGYGKVYAGGAESDQRARHEAVYQRLRNVYMPVYALAVFGDWIQGGFLYALYAEYGYSMRDIGLIFVAGYGSAATIGTYVGALGDVGGHRRNCVAYGVLYALSCALCSSGRLLPLLLGRILGGVAYSILYTSFESWLIGEATARALPTTMLSRLFSVRRRSSLRHSPRTSHQMSGGTSPTGRHLLQRGRRRGRRHRGPHGGRGAARRDARQQVRIGLRGRRCRAPRRVDTRRDALG